MVNVRLYGEAEFWFALIKVLAIIGMIAFGLWMLFGGHGGSKAGFDNLWKHGGFLATGWHGLILSLAVIMFSFGGLELIGITAAEAQNPEKSIPKAVNQVVYRILLFYIGSLVVLLALYPWVEIKSDSSPFVMIFHNLDSNLVASALNFVILVASLSVYNSGVYSNSRMLFGLSVQGNAPKFLARVSKRGVPVNSLLLSGIITSLVVVLNYLLPHEALGLLMAPGGGDVAAELDHDLYGAPEVPRRPAPQRARIEVQSAAGARQQLLLHCFPWADPGADVHYRRHASVGDPAAGVDPVPVYRLQTAAPPGVSEMPRRPAGLPAFLL